MAGSVTGSIGSNDVLLRNMATEETLSQLLEAIEGATITPGTPAQKKKDDKAAADASTANTKSVRRSTQAFEGVFRGIEGVGRVIRGLDSNVNNASYAFQAMSRGTGVFSKAMEFAANSVSQLQEQFNAYGKMMQVGGVVTTDFGKLSEQAIALGTDLQGLVKITSEYGFSLKSGSSSVANTLKGMRDQFNEMKVNQDEIIIQYGRLGIGINQITEQMLETAEAQGGYNAVLARYGGNTKAMNVGMLKATQDLNIFASAVGMNSKLMQDEAAQAMKKVENRIFVQNLNEQQQLQLKGLQAITGSAEMGIQVMRSMMKGATSEQAGLFRGLQNFTGIGKEIDGFMTALDKGSTLEDAIVKSGLLAAVNNKTAAEMDNFATQLAMMPDVEPAVRPLLNLMMGLKGTTPETLKDKIKDMTSAIDDKLPKQIDSYTKLLQEQNILATSTAALNTQINRLGLSFALAGMKSTNAVVNAGAFTKENIKTYFKELGIAIPDNMMDNINNVLEGKVQGDIQGQLLQIINDARNAAAKASGSDNATNTGARVSLRNTGMDRNTGVPVKMADDSIQMLRASDLVANRDNILSKTNAFGGPNNNAGTVATGAILAHKIPTISAITSGSDKHHAEKTPNSAHNKGLALDFGIANIANQTTQQTAQATIDRMHELLKGYGLTDKDYRIINESSRPSGDAGKHWTGAHIHLEFTRESAANTMRDLFKTIIPADDKQSSNTQPLRDGTAVTQVATAETPVKVSQASTSDVVNIDNRDSTVVAALEIHGDKIVNQFKQSARDIVEAVLNA